LGSAAHNATYSASHAIDQTKPKTLTPRHQNPPPMVITWALSLAVGPPPRHGWLPLLGDPSRPRSRALSRPLLGQRAPTLGDRSALMAPLLGQRTPPLGLDGRSALIDLLPRVKGRVPCLCLLQLHLQPTPLPVLGPQCCHRLVPNDIHCLCGFDLRCLARYREGA